MSEASPILVLVRNLVFSSKIMSEARAAGVAAKIVRDPLKLDVSSEGGSRLLIVDVSMDGAIPVAASWGRAAAGRSVVAFVAHVENDIITEAKRAGIPKVLPRGRFVKNLAQIVRGGQIK